jgi:hypothetical protein
MRVALMSRHSGLVTTLVGHEPPLAEVLPDAADWRAFFEKVHAMELATPPPRGPTPAISQGGTRSFP